MKSAVETLNPTRVRLTVEVPFEELKPSLDAAYKKINQQVTVPGFRKGKVPARIIDQRFGREAVLEEAINEALPRLYSEAVSEGELQVLGRPEVDVSYNDGDELRFTAEVDVRPSLEIPEYSTIEVTVDVIEVSEEEIDASLEQLRERFASTSSVDRPAAEGDVVVLDLEASVDGEVLPDGVAKGMSYVIGSGRLLDGVDEAVTGVPAGGTATFTTQLKGGSAAGREAEITVRVTAVQARELPALDDDFAQEASEFDTLEELREDGRKRLAQTKKYDQITQAQEKLIEALLELIEVPVPDRLLGEEIEARTHDLEHHLPSMGLTWESYLEREGKTREEYDAQIEEQARKGIKTQFILDELVSKEDVSVSQDELTAHLMQRAATSGMSPNEFVKAVVESGQVQLLVSEVSRGKALANVVRAAKVVDSNGDVVDLSDDEEAEDAATGETVIAADEAAEVLEGAETVEAAEAEAPEADEAEGAEAAAEEETVEAAESEDAETTEAAAEADAAEAAEKPAEG